MVPFLLVVVRFKAFDDSMDGITYASFIALGYAAVENCPLLPDFSRQPPCTAFMTSWCSATQ